MAHYDENILSDLYKDAHGSRPRELFWLRWADMTEDERDALWDSLCEDVERSIREEAESDARQIALFEQQVAKISEATGKDRAGAIRIWYDSLGLRADEVGFYGASFVCFEAGLPFSMGKVLSEALGIKNC